MMSIFKKIFYLWHDHTIGCCRALSALIIPVVISDTYSKICCCFLLLMWLILKTGYEKKWDKEREDDEQREAD